MTSNFPNEKGNVALIPMYVVVVGCMHICIDIIMYTLSDISLHDPHSYIFALKAEEIRSDFRIHVKST